MNVFHAQLESKKVSWYHVQNVNVTGDFNASTIIPSRARRTSRDDLCVCVRFFEIQEFTLMLKTCDQVFFFFLSLPPDHPESVRMVLPW